MPRIHSQCAKFASLLPLLIALFLVACEGPMGPVGPQGPQGDPGIAGAPGTQGAQGTPGIGLIDKKECITDIQVGTGFYIAAYHRLQFADGSRMVTCNFIGGSNESSDTRLYTQAEAVSGDDFCAVVFDVEANNSGGTWQFTFSSSSGNATVKYVDTGSSSNGRTYTIGCGQ